MLSILSSQWLLYLVLISLLLNLTSGILELRRRNTYLDFATAVNAARLSYCLIASVVLTLCAAILVILLALTGGGTNAL